MKRLLAAVFAGWMLLSLAVIAEESVPPRPDKKAPKKSPKATPKDMLDEPDDDDPTMLEKRNRYKLPEGADSDGLVDFCMKLQDYEPEDDDDAAAHERKLPRAIKRACKKIMTLEKDKESDNARFARRMLLAIGLDTAKDINSAKADTLLEKVRDFLSSPNVIADDADVADALADFLGSNPSPKAAEWSLKIGNLLAKNAIPDIAGAGKMLLGTSKRLSLVGKPMNLKGTTLDGKAFDFAQMKDKVVLIEFWATWCNHCVEDIPHLKRCYDSYHAKGFEIVAISADEERKELTDFIKSESVPWINLYQDGGKHPALDEFGIIAFPSTLFIGKDGKVISIDVRDEALDAELEKQLGPPPAPVKELKKPEHMPKEDSAEDKEDALDSVEKLKKKYSF